MKLRNSLWKQNSFTPRREAAKNAKKGKGPFHAALCVFALMQETSIFFIGSSSEVAQRLLFTTPHGIALY
ncbi:MAG: hypothetical protein DMG21_22350 [Acidobacteria bacterium]|nr:MAG: hypothetical protein DMG21_22350 [Acidobacteriota bacterium]